MTRDEVVNEARSWIGTPWQHQAALKGVGCDCIGLIAGVALALGSAEAQRLMQTPEYRNYDRKPDAAMLLLACEELLDPVESFAAALPADVLLMRFTGEPQHFGFLSERGQMIHAYAQAGKVVEQRIDMKWQRRVVGVYRLRGIQ
jgi:NlpC/P60 family putative phage cell wall peptidase